MKKYILAMTLGAALLAATFGGGWFGVKTIDGALAATRQQCTDSCFSAYRACVSRIPAPSSIGTAAVAKAMQLCLSQYNSCASRC